MNEKIVYYIDVGAALIKAREADLDPFKTLEAVMTWSKLVESVEGSRISKTLKNILSHMLNGTLLKKQVQDLQ
nr:hypothetical protein [Clostridium gasigenes]